MKNIRKILMIGGDRRMEVAYRELKKSGYEVDTLGLFENDSGDPERSDAILFPVPTTRDGKTVCCPKTDRIILIDDILLNAKNKPVLCCGLKRESPNIIDYGNLDRYAIRNAIPTVEGAVAEAIMSTPFTLSGSKVLVIGFGRVGKVLCDRLKAFGCDLTVSARSEKDLGLIEAFGSKAVKTSALSRSDCKFDIIFNTVDIPVFDKCVTDFSGVLMIDLSSKGCITEEEAEELGIRVKKLPGLPGKIAPETAGITVFETVKDILQNAVCNNR